MDGATAWRQKKFSIKTAIYIGCVFVRSSGTVYSPGTNCEVCQDIIKPLKHMISILRRIHTVKKEHQSEQIDQ